MRKLRKLRKYSGNQAGNANGNAGNGNAGNANGNANAGNANGNAGNANGKTGNANGNAGNDTLPQNKVGVVDFANAHGVVMFKSPRARRARGL